MNLVQTFLQTMVFSRLKKISVIHWVYWCAWRDSNPRPADSKRVILISEFNLESLLIQLFKASFFVFYLLAKAPLKPG